MGGFNVFVWGMVGLVCFFPMLNHFNGGVMAFHKISLHLQHRSAAKVEDDYRTGYHFQPPKHWINAPMFYKGFYHLFYQYNPKGSVWGNIVWAHSVSEDLINWTPLDPAIEPSKPFDQFGCWSGSATILPGEKPVILYTGIIAKEPEPGYQVQNYAIPKDYNDPYLKKWIKPDDNPIIKPTKENVSAFRDPTTAWKLNGQWEITVGSKQDTTGMSYLYRSPDFIKWTLVDHPLHQKEDTGMWECPDFYPVATTGKDGLDTMVVEGDIKHVFKVSLDITRNEYYTIGKYDTKEDKYIPDEGMIDGWAGLRYDWGNFYASKSFYDPAKKRRILWGWSNESSTEHESADVDVVFTLPGLDKAEVYDTNWDKTFPPESIARNICQVKGTTEQGGLGPFGLLTLTSKHFEEYTPVFFRVFNTPDTKHKHEYKPSFGGFVDVDLADNKISLRSLIDHSVVESFAAGGKTVITSRVYPTKALDDDNAHLYVFNNGTTTITVEKLDAWSMKKPKMN
ncbi:Concanavalin A-like lectin/glucanase superfamily [Cynara cardunculus var. scolymus]|uniref:Concanavalin A-like lectin/glucanase superfamily n=1 Tax=Cynara cardunculus var. scolymus TaxID=59895 RepID=A0A124SFK5_CYNCS|nr:Concanavalin A-like lectin/glucanase superfamily [Cynara cardunculus var. scolymus]